MTDPAPSQPHPATPANDKLPVIASDQSDLDRLDELAETLKEAELRLLLKLRRLTRANPHDAIRISTTQLASQTKTAQSAIRRALKSLAARNLITVRKATATEPTAIQVNAFKPTALPVPLRGTPPTAPNRHTPGLFEAHPMPLEGTPPTETAPLNPTYAAVDLDAASLQLIDRILSAKTKDFDPNLITQFRSWLHGYMCKMGRDEANRPILNPHPPGDDLVAQFLTIAEPRRLGTLLDGLLLDKQTCQTYGWFVAVAIQRIHGIATQQQRQARAALKIVRAAGRAENPTWHQETLASIGDVAAKKQMR